MEFFQTDMRRIQGFIFNIQLWIWQMEKKNFVVFVADEKTGLRNVFVVKWGWQDRNNPLIYKTS